METELMEIRDFIAEIPPFDQLPADLVEELTQEISIRYIRRGHPMPPTDIATDRLYILRKGAISLKTPEGNLAGMLGEGDICTLFCAGDNPSNLSITVEEDVLVYSIGCEKLTRLVKDHPAIVLSFIQNTAAQRLNQAVKAMQRQNNSSSSMLMHTTAEDIMHSPVITIALNASITDAAKAMTNNSVSCLIVTGNDDKLAGIVTIKDITKRCVAQEMDPATPVSVIMTSDILSLKRTTFAFDALMIMTRENVKHLPVIENDQLLGVVTSSDLIRHEGQNAAYLTGAIRKASSIQELKEHSKAVPQLQLQLVKMGATAQHVGKGVTAITSAITRRLLAMGEEKFGPPPAPYAWIAAGSQARREQTSHSDQDNGIIIADEVSDSDLPYYKELAEFVCTGLDECGYIFCPGEIMAMTEKWRQRQSVWSGYFSNWVNKPEPLALMHSSIFFDLRTIYGDKDLLEDIRQQVLEQTQKSSIFLAHLTANALKLKPPLGFFRDFVLIHDGEHNDTLDLKHNGIAPIVDLARIYSLAEGITEVNTVERLKLAAGTKSLSEEAGANLLDAFEFIGNLRIQHQAHQIQRGENPDNYMPPTELSKLEREHLKDAFKVIQSMQGSAERSYRAGGI